MYKKVILVLMLTTVLVVGIITTLLAYNFVDNFGTTNSIATTTRDTLAATVITNTQVLEGEADGEPETHAFPPRFYTRVSTLDVATLAGARINMQDFIQLDELRNEVDVEILYPQEIDLNNPGELEVVLNVVWGRTSSREFATIYIFAPPERAEIEVGTDIDTLMAYDFLTGVEVSPWTILDLEITSDLTGLTDEVGIAEVSLLFNGTEVTIPVDIVDTTPPVVTTREVAVRLGRDISPWDFIESATDASPPIMAVFAEPIMDTSQAGTFTARIAVSDYFNNSAYHEVSLTVLPNNIPPQIFGVADITAEIGTSIIFRHGVYATDFQGNYLEIFVDSSAVNIHELGVYSVTYYTYDAGGLRAEATAYVRVTEVDTFGVRQIAAEILEELITDHMTQVEQAQVIFDWISANVSYAAGFEPQSVYEGANMAFVHRRGDCFVFASVSEVMLNHAGIPNQRVDRIGGQNRHAWNLINPDNMGWHHFDATPIRVPGINRFMFTQSQAEAFTTRIYNQVRERNYFTFDYNLHPEVVQ